MCLVLIVSSHGGRVFLTDTQTELPSNLVWESWRASGSKGSSMTFHGLLLGFGGGTLKTSPHTENSDGTMSHPSLPIPSGEQKEILASCLEQQFSGVGGGVTLDLKQHPFVYNWHFEPLL